MAKKKVHKKTGKPNKAAVAKKVAELQALARMQQMQQQPGQMGMQQPQGQMPMPPMGGGRNPSAY